MFSQRRHNSLIRFVASNGIDGTQRACGEVSDSCSDSLHGGACGPASKCSGYSTWSTVKSRLANHWKFETSCSSVRLDSRGAGSPVLYRRRRFFSSGPRHQRRRDIKCTTEVDEQIPIAIGSKGSSSAQIPCPGLDQCLPAAAARKSYSWSIDSSSSFTRTGLMIHIGNSWIQK